MKFLTILLTIFALKTCDSTEQHLTKSKIQDMKLSGKYTIALLEKTNITNNLTIEFDDEAKRVSGFSGCNRYFGSFTISNDSISIGPLASTRKYCIGEANDIEYKFQNALSKVNKYVIKDNVISLFNDDEILIEAIKGANDKTVISEDYILTYTAITRGVFKSVIFKDNTITFQNNRADKPTIYKCTSEDIENISNLLKTIDLKIIPELVSPTKAHQYDGAAGATLAIEHSGDTYQTVTFDHGNPPKHIAELVNLIVALTESI